MFFERGEAPLVAAIEQRIAELLCWPVENGEGLQILRYRPGAEYRPHHDYFDPQHAGTARILERGGQRVGTLVVYLNTPQGGGATTFRMSASRWRRCAATPSSSATTAPIPTRARCTAAHR